ncbi:DMT family transporter [Streptomyces coerulescens]|uniref:DMT family transporter n=1 Tax=Streptomyces coerulescens TaxID=29304 RepID=A0ABW0CL09_STRCD
MSALALSVLLCLVSALCYAVGALLQERVAGAARQSAVRGTLRSGLWWAALSLNSGGALLHVLALRWGPLSLVQPLGALTLVFALPLSALGHGSGGRGSRVGRAAWAGVGLVSGGLAALTALVDIGPQVLLSARDQSVIAGLGLGAVALSAVAAAGTRSAAVRGAALAAAAGVAFGVASVHVKAVVAGWGVLPVGAEAVGLCLIVVLAVAGLAASQAAYRDAGLTVPLVTTTLVNPVVASLIGVAVMDDGFHHGAAGLALVVPAAGAAAVGLLLLVHDRAGREGVGRGERSGSVGVAAGVPRDLPGEAAEPVNHVPCLSAHGKRSHETTQAGQIPDARGGQSCRNSPYVSQ